MILTNPKFINDIQKFSNVLLMISVILDPTNTILGIKDFAFIFFIFCNINSLRFSYLFFPLSFFVVFFTSLMFGLVTKQNIEISAAFSILKSFLFLFYMFFVSAKHLNLFKVFYYVSLIMAGIEIFIYIVVLFIPFLETPIYLFMCNHDHTIMINKQRNFYGLSLVSTFYKTSPILVISEAYAIFAFFKTKQNKYVIHSALCIFGLLCSGTRANMLSTLLIIFIIFILYNFYTKKRLLSTVLFSVPVGFCAFLLILFMLTSSETSADIKSEHIKSFFTLFSNHPFIYAFLGSGPGTRMYSTGFNTFTTLTEITYLELIKNFGLIGTSFILFLLIIPIFYIFKNKNYDIFARTSFIIGYLAYLFIAGTNPLLIGSTGFTVIMIIYYIGTNNIIEEMGLFENKKKTTKILRIILGM